MNDTDLDKSDHEIFMHGIEGTYIGEMHISEFTGNAVISISSPILINNNFSGVLVINFYAEEIFDILTDTTGLGETGETYIVNKSNIMISPSRFLNNTFLTQKVDTVNVRNCFEHALEYEYLEDGGYVEEVHIGGEVLSFVNYRGINVLGTHAYIPAMHWALLAEIDESEAFNPIYIMRTATIYVLISISVIGLVVSFFISKSITKPIISLKQDVEHIDKGKLDGKIRITSNDEVGELANVFKQMIHALKKSRAEIENYSHNLEKQVSERTNDLNKSNIELNINVEKLEKNKLAMLNLTTDLRATITSLKKAEGKIKDKNLELEDVHEMLKKMNEELEDKVAERTAEIKNLLKQKDGFINQLGHDLKTPLTPVIALIPILEKRSKDSKSKEMLEIIRCSVNYMRDLVVKTIQLARLNAPSTQLDIVDTNLLEEANRIIDSNQLIFKENKITVENKIKDDIIVKADKLRLDELFNNLITNAVKYTSKSGNLIIDAKEEEDFVTISFKDTGIGLTKEQIDNIFDEFYKVDPSRHDLESSGLGLPICKRIVEKHGGKIWAESSGIGKGSTFHFTLKKSSSEKNN